MEEVKKEWEGFYKKVGLNVNLTSVLIPPKPKKRGAKLIFVPVLDKNFQISLFQKLVFIVDCLSSQYELVDNNFSINTQDDFYAIWVIDNKSYCSSKKRGLTLLETVIFEAKYFSETIYKEGREIPCLGTSFKSNPNYIPVLSLYRRDNKKNTFVLKAKDKRCISKKKKIYKII